VEFTGQRIFQHLFITIYNLSGIQNSNFKIENSDSGNQISEMRNQIPDSGNQKSELSIKKYRISELTRVNFGF
jgi:hypothetical protein